jgi:hypothetical protein
MIDNPLLEQQPKRQLADGADCVQELVQSSSSCTLLAANLPWEDKLNIGILLDQSPLNYQPRQDTR